MKKKPHKLKAKTKGRECCVYMDSIEGNTLSTLGVYVCYTAVKGSSSELTVLKPCSQDDIHLHKQAPGLEEELERHGSDVSLKEGDSNTDLRQNSNTDVKMQAVDSLLMGTESL